MAFDFNKYESLSRTLCARNDQEEYIRCSISRAYYSLYHKLKAFFNIPDKEYFRHEDMVNKIRLSNSIKKGSTISRLVDNLKQDRVNADYYRCPKDGIIFDLKYLSRFWMRYDNVIALLKEECFDEDLES